MKKIHKKGEVTTATLVTIIVLIASFVIILFLLFRLNLGAITDKEICHNSVVLKAQGKGLVGQLDCKTNYVCISGGGECEEINPTETINVNVDSKEEIMKAIADEMVDCWWMFGEGGLDYRATGDARDICGVCAVVKFDENIQAEYDGGITYKEFIDSLVNPIQRDSSENYLRYLFDVNNVDSLIGEFDLMAEYYNTKTLLLDEKYVIITGEVEAGLLRRIFGDEEKRSYIIPFPFEINNFPEDIVCGEYITAT
jgi:hypothetical protein